jgi:opacity protein-like surface antigen
MRRSFISVFLCVVVVPLLASAQDYPKAEIFGGYSYLHIGTHGVTSATLTQECSMLAGGSCPLTFHVNPNFQGWDASAQYNFNTWLGVKADVSGHYGKLVTASFPGFPLGPLTISPREHIYDFVFGPVASYRSRRYTAFANALFGAEHVGANTVPTAPVPISVPGPFFSETDFALVLGGGLDIRLTHHFSIRAGQFDYQFVSSSGSGHQNDLRFSTGVVIGFGGK